jgi:hypothetical protein
MFASEEHIAAVRTEQELRDAIHRAVAAERERSVRAIWAWSGLTDDEKRIAEAAIRRGEEPRYWEQADGETVRENPAVTVAVAAERERCVRLVFAYVEDIEDAKRCAIAIRRGEIDG